MLHLIWKGDDYSRPYDVKLCKHLHTTKEKLHWNERETEHEEERERSESSCRLQPQMLC